MTFHLSPFQCSLVYFYSAVYAQAEVVMNKRCRVMLEGDGEQKSHE